MLKNITISILLCCSYANANGQQSNNWVYGWRAGISFNKNPAKPFLSAIHDYKNDSVSCNYPQAISDCKGNLLYYIGGDSLVWNREHKLLNTMGKMNVHYDNNFFIPAPGNDSQVYLFLASNYAGFDYFLLNNNSDSGRGDFEKYKVHITDSNGMTSGFIKHINDTDYWVLYKASEYTMHAYLLTKNGINNKPVISSCYGTSSINGGANAPYLRCSNNGNMIISTELGYPILKNYRYLLYDFDKSTGKLSNGRGLIPKSELPISFSFSPNDSILYYTTYKTNGTIDSALVYQMHTYNSNPFNSKTLIGFVKAKKNKIYGNYSSQLGADNRLYTNISSDSLFQTLSYIKYPDIWGNGCEFITNGFAMLQGSKNNSQNFPCHSFPIKRINPRFGVTGANGCVYDNDSLQFKADADSAFKNYNWYFGDGDSAVGKSVVHQYKNAGSYYVRLGCELGNCDYMQWVGDSVTIKFKPNIALTDTTYYTCGQYHVQTKILYKYCDTVKLHLGNYDTILYTNNSSTVNTFIYNNTFDTNGTYIYCAAAKNKDCYDSVGLQQKVNIDAKSLAYFTPNYTQSCGNSTITLTDSSGGMDSLIQQRKWTIYYPNNIVKQYDTVSTNKLKLIVQDTGYYNAKLIYITKQGCTDSLYKTNVFRILPQPVVYIDSPSHNPLCFGDSFILTAKQKDINYPPFVKYKWNAGQVSTPSIKVDTANSYYVAAVNTFGCGAQSNTVKIDFLPQLFANIKTAKDSLYTIATRPIVSYTWYKDSILYNTASSLFHPPTGRYYVHVVDANGCMANSGSLLHTGVNHIEGIESCIYVYPNPVSDVLYVELVGDNTNQRQARQVVMCDMTGRIVYNNSTNGEVLYNISIGYLSKGLYILSVGEEKIKLVVE